MATESSTLDLLDRRILHALQIAPRAPFARIATVLDVSEQTVARRFQRMRTEGVVRIIARPEVIHRPGATAWTLRIGCRPGTAGTVANALAQRGDTSWVSIGGGGAEVTCQADVDDPQSGLLHHLPRASSVLTFSAHQLLHRFAGRGEVDWIVPDHDLAPEHREFLMEGTPVSTADPTGKTRLESSDRPLLDALSRDGRSSWAAIATATGWSQRQAAHRVNELAESGAVYFHVDVATSAVGMHTVANLWFTVAPAHLASTGARLADHPQLAFVGAVTGSANLMASAIATGADALYQYVTTKVAEIDSIQRVEIVPQLVRLKHAHSLVENGRIREPRPQ